MVALVVLRWLPLGAEAPAPPVAVPDADVAQPTNDTRTTDTAPPPEDASPRDVRGPDATDEEPSLVLTVAPAQARVGQDVEVVVRGSGPIRDAAFTPPDGIATRSQSRTTQINIVRGVTRRKAGLTVVVSADAAGEYTLGPATAQLLEGGSIESNAVVLRVSAR